MYVEVTVFDKCSYVDRYDTVLCRTAPFRFATNFCTFIFYTPTDEGRRPKTETSNHDKQKHKARRGGANDEDLIPFSRIGIVVLSFAFTHRRNQLGVIIESVDCSSERLPAIISLDLVEHF